MDYRELAGNSVSLLGYGCMRFPTNEAGEIDEPRAEKLLLRAYEQGVNYFDVPGLITAAKANRSLARCFPSLTATVFTLQPSCPCSQ